MEERVKYTFRAPRELLDKLQVIADEHRRSVNSEMIVILEEYFKSHQSASEEEQSSKN